MNLKERIKITVETYDQDEPNNPPVSRRSYFYDPEGCLQMTLDFPHPFLSWIKGVFISEGFVDETVNRFFGKPRE